MRQRDGIIATMTVYSVLVLFAGLQLIAAQFDAVSQSVPQECLGPPPNMENPLLCCEAPQIFETKVFQECGYEKIAPIGRSGGDGSTIPIDGWDPVEAREYERPNLRNKGQGRLMHGMPVDNREFPDYGMNSYKPRQYHSRLGKNPRFYARRQGQNQASDCTRSHCVLNKYGLLKDGNIDNEEFQRFLDQYSRANTETAATIQLVKNKCFGKPLRGRPDQCEADKLFLCISSTFFFDCPTWKESPECETLTAILNKCKPYIPLDPV